MVREFISTGIGGAFERARVHADSAPGAAHGLGDRSGELRWGDGHDRGARSAERRAVGPGCACGFDDAVEPRNKIPPERDVQHVVQRGAEKRTVTVGQSLHEGSA
jgi:hypothetical protein